MRRRKPVPLLLVTRRPSPLRPSAALSAIARGYHPQCAERRADAPRMDRVRAAAEIAERKGKAADSSTLGYWHKRCPQCRTQLHLRKMTCVCGYRFDETR